MFPVFATPCLTSSVSLEFFMSYMGTSLALTQRGIPHAITTVVGDCYLSKARNRLVHQFLHNFPDATDLFFLDDDIGWEPESVLRLLEADVDVVAGIYPHKSDAGTFPVDLLAVDGDFVEKDGLLRASTVPTGFLRIQRHVIETMIRGCPAYSEVAADGSKTMVQDLFQMGYMDGKWWGEDTDFCRRWNAMGGEIWVDPAITLTHSGRKRWTGTLMDRIVEFRAGQAKEMAA